MRGPKPHPIELAEQTRTELKKLIKKRKAAQQIALRGRIILACSEGKNNCQIAREFGISHDMVRLWRKRWLIAEFC